MRIIRFLLLLTLFLGIGYYFLQENNMDAEDAIDKFSKVLEQKKSLLESKEVPKKRKSISLEGDVFQWIEKPSDKLLETFGEPLRKDLSAYGYTWWVYTDQFNQYIQFGVRDDKVVTIFATGNDLSIEPVKISESYASVNDQFSFNKMVNYSKGLSSYTFHLNEEDLKMRPLAKITDDIFIQFYFDTFTKELSSIRVIKAETLLKHRPYEIEYRGDLPESPDLTDKEWKKVESGMEQQIFDITNVMRNQYEKDPVDWASGAREVAFLHSKDMADNNYFSHYALNGEGLKERLAEKDIDYRTAGENIAAQYPDAAAAMEGWLNSEGHREALLNNEYTHLGVGVYRFYYTQNFLSKL
ncbi:CAP domain-containing protein [Virgibacillus alimentarius]|uniref:Uncharacterized protein YkwD n=1 Tax=Virgibacillus alimentarius TaxID=698769 RepID=A0ABS4S3M8_9BACI|nr:MULTISPECIES: CAP domain-containing protein [Virgibacillus]MBP2256088.1 uncharacterized protein YkwD [Virgibacillus alimentarius]HLR66035.1 CAP domain-containing protein [Virgibacillus sp.]